MFKKNLPPKTTFNNLINIPHLEIVLLWFLQNDKQMQTINSEAIHILFNEGMRPDCDKDNDPDILIKEANDSQEANTIERWLVLKTWLDLIIATKMAKNTQIDFKEAFEKIIDYIEKQTESTLIIAGEIANKYGLNVNVDLNLGVELSKIKTNKEKENFKYNYLSDSILSSEVRILAWIYKDLFNENYQIKE